jgi:ABC-type transporter Mla maintaining outer membrane lipid asymmetry permease subunit MlaE
VTNRLNSGIHRFIVSEDGYLCALSTTAKITLLRLVPFSQISKVVLCRILRYITVFLLCLQVVVGVSSASGKLQFVFDVSSTKFVNDFTDFQVTVNICLV